MKKDNQKILLFIIIGILLLVSIMAFIMGTKSNKSNNDTTENPKQELPLTPVLNTEIVRLDDTNTIFAIQKTISNFYTEMFNNKANAILLLDKDFVFKYTINENNINNYVNSTNENVNFIATEVYYNPNSNMTYYFIKGYTIDGTNTGDNLKYTNNLYYILKVDMENNYNITPLKDIENLETYIKNYYFSKIYIDNTTKFEIKEVDAVDKLIAYITNFKSLMYINSNEAFNILNDPTKSKYANLKAFMDDRENINEKLSLKFNKIDVKEEGNILIYNIINNNRNSITITEFYPNEYKIDFNFLEITQ